MSYFTTEGTIVHTPSGVVTRYVLADGTPMLPEHHPGTFPIGFPGGALVDANGFPIYGTPFPIPPEHVYIMGQPSQAQSETTVFFGDSDDSDDKQVVKIDDSDFVIDGDDSKPRIEEGVLKRKPVPSVRKGVSESVRNAKFRIPGHISNGCAKITGVIVFLYSGTRFVLETAVNNLRIPANHVPEKEREWIIPSLDDDENKTRAKKMYEQGQRLLKKKLPSGVTLRDNNFNDYDDLIVQQEGGGRLLRAYMKKISEDDMDRLKSCEQSSTNHDDGVIHVFNKDDLVSQCRTGCNIKLKTDSRIHKQAPWTSWVQSYDIIPAHNDLLRRLAKKAF